MKRSLSEQKVLKKLDISDFRHLSKDKVVQFVSMLPYMEPEVAKKALEQFPSFVEYAAKIVSEYKESVETALKGNTDSQDVFYKTCDCILRVLEHELQKETLLKEEKQFIEEELLKVVQMIYDKDAENKRFILKVIATAGVTLVGVVATVANVLGANHQARFPNEFEII